MKKLLLGMVAIPALIATPAQSADMPLKAPPPVISPAYNWSGFYVGVSGGGAWGSSNLNNVIFDDGPPPAHTAPLLAAVNALSSGRIHSSGGIVGVQAGYDMQVNQFVFGGVIDFSAMDLRGSRNAAGGPDVLIGIGSIAIHDDISTNWLMTLRGRVGVAAGNFLLYATGGAAATNVKYNHSYTVFAGSTGTEVDSVSRDRLGWAVGAGADYALSNRVSLRGEYLHVGFGTVVSDGVRVNDSATGPLNTVFGHNVSLNADIVRAGINLKLN